MLYVFCGDGKGKTTAAIGSIIRGYGAGKSCAIVFFDKNQEYCSELGALLELGIHAYIFGANRIEEGGFRLQNGEADVLEAKKALNKARELAVDKFDVLVLDEFLNALRLNFFGLVEGLELIDSFPKEKCLVLTGRGLPEEIALRADLVSEVKKIKHPFDQGAIAAKGIDY